MTEESEAWFVVRTSNGQCEILADSQQPPNPDENEQRWGPFSSKSEATARRVGLIRAGKCQPA